MQAVTENITRIQNKLQELVKKYQSAQKEADQQQKIIENLRQQQVLNEKKIKTLEEQQHILKSAAGGMNEKDKKEFEQVIGKYIKEIDKCIALLSE
jgi:predicted AlkP superfamily phosphohydrolase/phosphomutase